MYGTIFDQYILYKYPMYAPAHPVLRGIRPSMAKKKAAGVNTCGLLGTFPGIVNDQPIMVLPLTHRCAQPSPHR